MIKLYTSSNCPHCEEVKNYLNSIGQEFETINISENKSAAREVINLTKQRTLPVLVSESNNYVVGFDKERIYAVLMEDKSFENNPGCSCKDCKIHSD